MKKQSVWKWEFIWGIIYTLIYTVLFLFSERAPVLKLLVIFPGILLRKSHSSRPTDPLCPVTSLSPSQGQLLCLGRWSISASPHCPCAPRPVHPSPTCNGDFLEVACPFAHCGSRSPYLVDAIRAIRKHLLYSQKSKGWKGLIQRQRTKCPFYKKAMFLLTDPWNHMNCVSI